MEKTLIITGKGGSGKTSLALEKCKNIKDDELKYYGAMDIESPFCFMDCNKNTKVIIIDNIKKEDLDKTLNRTSFKSLQIHNPMKEPFIIKPKFILVFDFEFTQDDLDVLGLSYSRRFKVLKTEI